MDGDVLCTYDHDHDQTQLATRLAIEKSDSLTLLLLSSPTKTNKSNLSQHIIYPFRQSNKVRAKLDNY